LAQTPTTVNLDQFETKAAYELESRGVGTVYQQMMIRGNSILSSVYVKSIDVGATLSINYYDTTTGDDGTGERFDLKSHAIITDADAGKTFRIVVPRIHNKPKIEAIIAGGNVEFGVYITVVADFPNEESFSGATAQFAGAVTTTPTQIPTLAGEALEEFEVACPIDSTSNLLVSLDNSVWHDLAPRDAFSWQLHGRTRTQIWVKAKSGTALYHLVLNKAV
jgi:hypothetical protein